MANSCTHLIQEMAPSESSASKRMERLSASAPLRGFRRKPASTESPRSKHARRISGHSWFLDVTPGMLRASQEDRQAERHGCSAVITRTNDSEPPTRVAAAKSRPPRLRRAKPLY